MKNLTITLLLLLSATAFSQQMYQGKFTATGKSITGVWVDEGNNSIVGDIKTAIYTENKKLMMAIIASEVYTVFPLEAKEVNGRTRYYDARPNSSDYYIINPEGLLVFDDLGYVFTYKNTTLDGSFNVMKANAIGVWHDHNYPASEGTVKLAIYPENDIYKMIYFFKDDFKIYNLEKKVVNNETRYYSTPSKSGDYYVISAEGLKIFDNLGYIATYKKTTL